MKTIFYCWQGDLDSKYNRNLIEKAITKAIKRVNATITEGENYQFDKDTLNEPGSPDIVETILKKISNCSLLIADITPITKVNEKAISNPNVLLELGYAIGKLGFTRVVCVNNQYYCKSEFLPFDLKTKRILNYECSPVVEIEESLIINKLSKAFENNIKLIESAAIEEPDNNATDDKIKKARDIKKIKRLLEAIPIKVIQHHIDIGRNSLHMDFHIFTVYYNVLSIVGFGTFILYDTNCFELVNNFVDSFSKTFRYSHAFHNLKGNTLKFDNRLEDEAELYIIDINELEKTMQSLLTYLHHNFVEIDLDECNKIAWVNFRNEIEDM